MEAGAPPRRAGSPPAAGVLDAYLRALLDADVVAAARVVEDAVQAGVAVPELYLRVLQPALYEIGARWSRAEISVAQEHLATATTQSLMTRLAEQLPEGPVPHRGRALVACAADEMHVLGPRMVADFLEADGWEVLFVGALTPPEDLAGLAAARGVELVALSAALPERIPQVARACTALRTLEPAPFVVVGGQAFAGSRERALATGADAYAHDAAEAARVVGGRRRNT
jgi:methanogenic corrinoid protein MtbC1